jgi:AraC family transcriptional regulator of adaptative response/methylated-DNA-[protein]-cysteine methyltransferase
MTFMQQASTLHSRAKTRAATMRPKNASTRSSAQLPSRAKRVKEDPRWAQVRARDARADDTFFYSVKTTGVYCRPSCAARLARPENVAFHATRNDAERAGFRPCKRCRPEQPPLSQRRAEQIAKLCRLIEQSEHTPSLQQLAEHIGLSVFHSQRLFKSVMGMTPRAYAAAQRAGRMRTQLGKGGSVTEAIYAAGYGSSARFYEKSKELLGMSPKRYQQGAPTEEIHYAFARCSLGRLLVAATARGICAIFLGEQQAALQRELRARFPRASLRAAAAEFARTLEQVVALVENPHVATQLPLDIQGSAFQQRVWQALRKIPAGETLSYSELARRIGQPSAARAVAAACAANTLAVVVPCHRVVRGDGSLSGYRWGVQRKRALLEREAKP